MTAGRQHRVGLFSDSQPAASGAPAQFHPVSNLEIAMNAHKLFSVFLRLIGAWKLAPRPSEAHCG
jgi:hypothetical protein